LKEVSGSEAGVCAFSKERERERVCVCEREREREIDRQTERKKNVGHQTSVKPAPPSKPVPWVYVSNSEPTRITRQTG
jgi:hypothetical protein